MFLLHINIREGKVNDHDVCMAPIQPINLPLPSSLISVGTLCMCMCREGYSRRATVPNQDTKTGAEN